MNKKLSALQQLINKRRSKSVQVKPVQKKEEKPEAPAEEVSEETAE